MEFSKDSFALVSAGGGYLFDSSQPGSRAELEDELRTVRDSLLDFASIARPASSEIGSVHNMLLDSLAVIESIGNSRFASKPRADFAQKCREHHGYLSWKCGEQSALAPGEWGAGVTFTNDTIE